MYCGNTVLRYLAVISLRSDTGQVSRHILPYNRSLRATVLHINHKENNLYVRPDIFHAKAAALDFRLRCIAFDSLEPLGTRNVKIGLFFWCPISVNFALVENNLNQTFSYPQAVCN